MDEEHHFPMEGAARDLRLASEGALARSMAGDDSCVDLSHFGSRMHPSDAAWMLFNPAGRYAARLLMAEQAGADAGEAKEKFGRAIEAACSAFEGQFCGAKQQGLMGAEGLAAGMAALGANCMASLHKELTGAGWPMRGAGSRRWLFATFNPFSSAWPPAVLQAHGKEFADVLAQGAAREAAHGQQLGGFLASAFGPARADFKAGMAVGLGMLAAIGPWEGGALELWGLERARPCGAEDVLLGCAALRVAGQEGFPLERWASMGAMDKKWLEPYVAQEMPHLDEAAVFSGCLEAKMAEFHAMAEGQAISGGMKEGARAKPNGARL